MSFATLRGRLSPAQINALRWSVGAVASSRLAIWVSSMAAVRAFGVAPQPRVLGPGPSPVLGRSLSAMLQAPVVRWDAAWYLAIAAHGYALHDGYTPPPRTNFFPLYPLLVGSLHAIGMPLVLGALLVSVVAMTVALYLLARLVAPELGEPAGGELAAMAVFAVALSPVSFFLSSGYAESVFLALSVGALLAARRGRWAMAGLAAGVASAARGPGLVLVVPLVILYLRGPRGDRPPDRPSTRWGPRYRVAPDALWLALAPAGVVAFMVYLGTQGVDALSFVRTQHASWDHVFAWPWVTLANGARLAFSELRALLDGRLHATLVGTFAHASVDTGWDQLLPFAALVVAAPAVVGVWRRLPRAYGVYVVMAVLLNLVTPVSYEPLQGMPRYLLVLFPLFIWFAQATTRRPRLRLVLLTCSGVLLGLLSATFATGHFVA